MMTCAGCGRVVDDLAPDAPCPECGSHGRRVHAGAASVVGATSRAGHRIRKGDVRVPFVERWGRVLRLRAETGEMLAHGRVGNVELEESVIGLLVECWHVRDSLVALGLSRRVVFDYFERYELGIAGSVANTYKHEGRDPDKRVARIREVEVLAEGGARVTIEVDWAQPNAFPVDALELADGCIAMIRAFLRGHGIPEP